MMVVNSRTLARDIEYPIYRLAASQIEYKISVYRGEHCSGSDINRTGTLHPKGLFYTRPAHPAARDITLSST